MENLLTAYNEQVRKYTAAPTAKARTSKVVRMAMIAANFTDIFEKAFTPSRKKVLDEIVYKSSETGVYTASRETIATNTGKSVRTVERAVAELKKTDEFIVARTANGRAGTYVFVDRKHENFATIAADLFGADKLEAALGASVVAGLENAETPTESKAQAAKTDEPTVLPALNAPKQEPKNLNNGSESNNADKSEERPTAIYVRLSEVLARMFGKNKMKHVMRKLEGMRKNMQISDDLAVTAAQETANDSKCRNFFALWSYKIKVALGIINPRAKLSAPALTKELPVTLTAEYNSLSKKDRLKVDIERKEQQINEIAAMQEENLKTHEQPEWLYKNQMALANRELADLQAEFNKPEEHVDIESKRIELLQRLGYGDSVDAAHSDSNAPAPKTDDSPFDFAAEVARIKAEANAC